MVSGVIGFIIGVNVGLFVFAIISMAKAKG